MALLNSATATGGNPRVPQPIIFVDIFQPEDFGPFVVEVSDPSVPSDKPICANQLPADYSLLQCAQAAKLLESSRTLGDAMKAGADWKKTPRYQEMMRFGRKLYSDLFGTTDTFLRYVKRSRHLQGGFQILLRLYNTGSELWAVPWEYAHDGEMFIVGERGWSLIRTLRDVRLDEERAPNRPMARPLNILVVLADPAGDDGLNLDEDAESIKAALADAEARGFVTVDFVEEGTLRNLDLALSERDYHVLHFNGRAALTGRGPCLILEDEDGEPYAAAMRELIPVLREDASLRMVIMSACRSGSMGEMQAICAAAPELMGTVPALLTMQYPVTVTGARAFLLPFYGTLSQGGSVEDAVQAGRMGMQRASEQKIDWGTPALYVQRSAARIVDSRSPLAARELPVLDLELLPKPKVFTGRRSEQRIMRARMMQLNVASIFVWGLPGIGKSALVRRVIERPGRTGIVDDALVIDCAAVNPRDLLEQLTRWLGLHFPKTIEIMRNPLMTADVRLIEAAPLVRGKRLILVIDRFDMFMNSETDDIGALPNRQLNDFFKLLAAANWTVLTVFTSRRYWNALPELVPKHTVAIHVRELEQEAIGALFRQVEHLRRVPTMNRMVLLDSVGGHPGTLSLIETAIARDTSRAGMIDHGFIRSLLSRLEADWLAGVLQGLSNTDVNILTAVSFLGRGFWSEHVKYIARLPTNLAAEEVMVRWEIRGVCDYLFDDENREPWYTVPAIIRSMLLSRLSEPGRKSVHRRVAETVQFSFYLAAQRLSGQGIAIDVNQENPFETAIESLRYQLERSSMSTRRHLVEVALDWREHWDESDLPENGRAVIGAVWHSIAYSFGQIDRAEELLTESLQTARGREGMMIRADLASLTVLKGRPDEAMEQYGALAAAFSKLGDGASQAAMLSQQARLTADKNVRRAVALENEALQLRLKLRNAGAVAESYRALTRYKQMQQDHNGAIKMAEEAWGYAEKSGNKAAMAAVLLTRGSLLAQAKEYREAVRLLEKSIEYAQAQNELVTLAEAYTEISEIHRIAKNYDVSAHFLMDAVEIGERINEPAAVAYRTFRLAQTYAALRAYDDAHTMAERSLELARVHRPDLVTELQGLLKQIQKVR